MTDEPAPKRSLIMRILRVQAWLLLAVLAFFLWPSQWGGNTTYVVVKGTSMQPDYHTGDIVIARESESHDVGDVLVYAVPDEYTGAGKLIMHRLMSIDRDGRYTIQGDNRDTADQFDVGPEDVVGVARVHVPKLGAVTGLIGQWWFIALLVSLFAFLKLWPDQNEDKDDDADASPDGSDEQGAGSIERRRRGDRRDRALYPPADDLIAPLMIPAPPETAATPGAAPPVPPVAAWPPPGPVPAKPVRRPRAYVIVDGDGLATAGWPGLRCDDSRWLCLATADEIASRFGTTVAVIFGEEAAGLPDRTHAYVQVIAANETVAETIRQHFAQPVSGMTMLVVTDSLPVTEQVLASDGSVMRCAAWLTLGEQVGVPISQPLSLPTGQPVDRSVS